METYVTFWRLWQVLFQRCYLRRNRIMSILNFPNIYMDKTTFYSNQPDYNLHKMSPSTAMNYLLRTFVLVIWCFSFIWFNLFKTLLVFANRITIRWRRYLIHVVMKSSGKIDEYTNVKKEYILLKFRYQNSYKLKSEL